MKSVLQDDAMKKKANNLMFPESGGMAPPLSKVSIILYNYSKLCLVLFHITYLLQLYTDSGFLIVIHTLLFYHWSHSDRWSYAVGGCPSRSAVSQLLNTFVFFSDSTWQFLYKFGMEHLWRKWNKKCEFHGHWTWSWGLGLKPIKWCTL